MSWLRTILLFGAAILAVFWEAAFQGFRHLFGTQIDLLPALMVYASLQASFGFVCLFAVVGGLLFDSLSANPLGVSVLPLLAVGWACYAKRDLILRDQAFAQGVLGLVASAAVPALTLMLLLSMGSSPLLGWGTLWQILLMSLSGAVAAPLLFAIFDWLERTLSHGRATELSFRPDREIRRGR